MAVIYGGNMEQNEIDLNKLALEIQKRSTKAQSVTWILVAERLPEPDLRVLAVYKGEYKSVVIRAIYLPAKYAACYGDYDESVYDEETDQSYYPEGWYEAVEEQEYSFYGPLPNAVTHWEQLPALPSRV